MSKEVQTRPSNGSDDFRTKQLNLALNTKKKLSLFLQRCVFLNKMRENGIMCDVKIITQDGVELKAHKIILSGASQFFFNIFNSEFDESKVKIEDINSQILEMILNYIYTSHIMLTDENIEGLLHGADYLLVETLKEKCCQYLQESMSVTNVLRLHFIADTFACQELLKNVNEFILKNFKDVMNDERFLNMDLKIIKEFLKSDELNVSSERIVYNAVIRYIMFDIEKRKEHFYDLLQHVRLAFLGKDRLIQIACSQLQFMKLDQEHLLNALIEEDILFGNLEDTLDKRVLIPRFSYALRPLMYVIGGSQYSTKVRYFDTRKYGAACVYTNKRIYIMGGNQDNDWTMQVKIYNLETKLWTEGVSVPDYRTFSASVVLNDKIYLMGGSNNYNGNTVYRSCQCFNIKVNKWSPINDMNELRTHASAAVMNGKIFIVGGIRDMASPQTVSNSVEYFDPALDKWNLISTGMSIGRFGLGVAVENSILYAVGGRNAGSEHNEDDGKVVEAYDSSENSWTRLPNLMIPRHLHGVVIEDGYIYAVGGLWYSPNNTPTKTSSIEVFCLDSNKWFKFKKGLQEVSDSSCVVIAYADPE